MAHYTIYHNPRCSKSRQTLALLNERGIEPEVRLYLETGLNRDELKAIAKKLDQPVSAFMRPKEAEYRELGLGPDSDTDRLLDALVSAPKLLERPLVVCGDRAVIGRPPENVLALIS